MPLTARFHFAMSYASALHAGQVRKGTSIPYISHPMAVAGIVLENGGTEDEAIAALLHDGPEDQGGQARLDEIEGFFGPAVAQIVADCTDSLVDTTTGAEKPPWRERKEHYLAHLRGVGPSTRLVSIADKLHNARSIARDVAAEGDDFWTRFNADRDAQLWYYRGLHAVFAASNDHRIAPLVDELQAAIARF